ncbi:hypothetical protein E2C01_097696 [Portunus trituberculatus]|uniref:Uncharacterized protein n=1 Tax=Portunus trituberculatus TaxID=210409 RepID=A0A5B7K6D1_PORTR|nr:hypothetical protein [Portunus trituberculatus]
MARGQARWSEDPREITDTAIFTTTPVEVAVSKSIKLGHSTSRCRTISGSHHSRAEGPWSAGIFV